MGRSFQTAVIAFVILCLQACNLYAEPESGGQADQKRIAGHYIYGHEVNSYQPCGQKKVYWVVGSNEVLQLLEHKYAEHTSKLYEEVYAEIAGDYIGKAKDGFAMDYDGQIRVNSLHVMKRKSESDCR